MLGMTYGLFYRLLVQKGDNDLRQLEMPIFRRHQEVFNHRVKSEKLLEDLYLENLIMQYDLDGFGNQTPSIYFRGPDQRHHRKKHENQHWRNREANKTPYEKLDIAEHVREDQGLVSTQPAYVYN